MESKSPSYFKRFENIREVLLSHLLFLILAFFGCNFIDIFMKRVFDYIESTKLFSYIFKKDSNMWLLTKITIQLILVSYLVHQIKKFKNYLLLSFDSDNTIYGSSTVTLIFAFVAFYSQDNLKSYLKTFNKKLDKRFS